MKSTFKLITFAFFLTISTPVFCCPKSDCVRIGTWNIAWLGSEKRNQSSDASTIESIAEMIAEVWSMDLIGLQEINTDLDGKFRGENYSTTSWKTLKTALEKRGYQTRSGSSGHGQRVVLAWRSPVKSLLPIQEIDIPESYQISEYCRSSGLRKPLGGYFRANAFDFFAVSVHLKSGYGSNSACSNAVRSLQTELLSNHTIKLEKTDRDLILLGDFNASGKHESLKNLREKNFSVLTDKNHRTPGSNTKTQGTGNRGNVIDLIMIKQSDTKEWIKSSTEIFRPENPVDFAKKYSDHLPVWTDFRTTNDDD